MTAADQERLRRSFADRLDGDVRVVLAVHDGECETCSLTREILGEITTLSDRLSLDVRAGGDALPRIDLRGRARGRVRFFGLPSGHELPAFIDSIVDVSLGSTTLSSDALSRLAALDHRVHLQVFTTPT